jgi:hypothetical protein
VITVIFPLLVQNSALHVVVARHILGSISVPQVHTNNSAGTSSLDFT